MRFKIKESKYLTFIAMLAAIILPCATIMVNKVIIITSHSTASAGTLVMPLWFILNDIITEVYGYKTARRIFWYAAINCILFTLMVTILTTLPSPQSSGIGDAYKLTLGNVFHIICGGLISLVISSFVNTYLLSKWKILLRGRFFWLRSLGCSSLGEGIYTILGGILIFFGTYSNENVVMFILWSLLFKILGSIILSGPANLIVIFLKHNEKIDIYDNYIDFNPFKVSV